MILAPSFTLEAAVLRQRYGLGKFTLYSKHLNTRDLMWPRILLKLQRVQLPPFIMLTRWGIHH